MIGPTLPISKETHATKYRAKGEDFKEAMSRIAHALQDDDEHYHSFREILLDMRFLPAGRVQAALGASRKVTGFNCYVSGTIADSFVDGDGSIMQRAAEAAATMRMGGGIGYDFSTLRPSGELIRSLQSRASGPVSFMGIFDAVCQTVASAGHRRGAQMGVLRVDHPDVEEFIHAKQNSHNLTGFNISLGITDEFMQCVIDGTDFDLRWNGKIYKTIDARNFWEQIMRSTWSYAEPGVLFLNRINDMNNLWYCETISATNPCFTGDTKVWTAYGPKNFLELVGKEVPVLTQTMSGKLAYKKMKNIRRTKIDASLVEVTMRGSGRKAGSYTKITCTPDHQFFLTNGVKCEAKELKKGMKIYSAYRRKANQKGYVLISGKHDSVMEHHLAAEFVYGRRPNYPLEHCHHIDGNSLNNIPENVEILNSKEHNSQNMKLKNDNGLMFHNSYTGNPGSSNGRYRRDLDDTEIENLRADGLSYLAIAKELGCSKYTVMKRLGWERNHTIVSVKQINRKEDVYCGTVEDTGRFFIYNGENEGVLVSNCAEQPLPPFGACLLGSFNLAKYIKVSRVENTFGLKAFRFDWNQLRKDIPIVVRAMDNVTDRTLFPLKEQAAEAKSKRRMGLGLTGLANAAEAIGYSYGSGNFLRFQGRVMRTINEGCYQASTQLAKEKGPFPLFDKSKYLKSMFIQSAISDKTKAMIKENGIRNSHLTSVAPTGTISLCADNVSSGIEPVYAYSFRRTVITESGPRIEHVEDYGVREFKIRGKTSSQCSADDHLNALIEAYKWVDSAVSKTCNVNPKMPWEEFKNIYIRAWKGGCKGCTTFNPSGERAGILNADDEGPREEVEACFIDPVTGARTCE